MLDGRDLALGGRTAVAAATPDLSPHSAQMKRLCSNGLVVVERCFAAGAAATAVVGNVGTAVVPELKVHANRDPGTGIGNVQERMVGVYCAKLLALASNQVSKYCVTSLDTVGT